MTGCGVTASVDLNSGILTMLVGIGAGYEQLESLSGDASLKEGTLEQLKLASGSELDANVSKSECEW